ncbi:MAG: sensor histidine kinase [Bacillota bacterium]
MATYERLTAALKALPASPSEAELLQALARIPCTELGWTAARVRTLQPEGVAASWPKASLLRPELTLPLTEGMVLEAEGAGDGPALELFAAVAGRLLEEVRQRCRLSQRIERLSRRSREAEERHRNLTLRLAELRGELDTTQQQHVVLSERNRIAQDLHDRAAQTNFLLSLKLDWALAHLADEDPLRPELERLKELAAQAAAQTREAIYALRASEMAEGGLVGGLRRLVRSMKDDGFVANLTVTGIPVPLTLEVEDALFKLAQEALNNTRKHSRGSAVIVALRFAPTLVTLVVEDDGVGLSGGELIELPGRLGVKGMRERVASLGGEFELMNGDEDGLIVRATIPLKGAGNHGDSDRHRG